MFQKILKREEIWDECFDLWEKSGYLINKGNITSFIDDVLVATETKEDHDEIVEKVLGYMEENDLYIKPEECT